VRAPRLRSGVPVAFALALLAGPARPAQAASDSFAGCIVGGNSQSILVKTSGGEVLQFELAEFKNTGGDSLARDECYNFELRLTPDGRMMLVSLSTPPEVRDDRQEEDDRVRDEQQPEE
jgi:hypothetical protein